MMKETRNLETWFYSQMGMFCGYFPTQIIEAVLTKGQENHSKFGDV